jgi:alpha-methylacyl-CoA racemase
LSLVGDYGGGGSILAIGILAALYEARTSGKGQVVDAAMVDGSAILMSMMYGFKAAGMWKDERGVNLLDTGAHFYDTYETADGKWVSIGSIEPQFYALLLQKTGLAADPEFQMQMNQAKWPALKEKVAAVIKTKTRDEWCAIMEGTDVCFAPVLSLSEAPKHPHCAARKTFVEYDGKIQPAPAPRFSRTPPEIRCPSPNPGEHNETALLDWGFSKDEVKMLLESGAL